MFQEANHFFGSGGFFFGLGGGGFFFALGSGGPFFFALGSGGPPFALPLAPAGRGGPLFLVGGGFFFAPPGSGGPLLSPASSGGFFLSPPALAPKCSQLEPVEKERARVWTGANLPGRGGPFFAAFAPPSGGLKATAQTRQREGPRGREGSAIAHSAPFFFLPIESFDTVFSELFHPRMGSSNHKRNRSCQVHVDRRSRSERESGFLTAPSSCRRRGAAASCLYP